MPGAKGRSGGARPRSGPVQKRYTLRASAAVYVRALTQGRLNRIDVTSDECSETLHQIVREYEQTRDATHNAALIAEVRQLRAVENAARVLYLAVDDGGAAELEAAMQGLWDIRKTVTE